MLKGVQGTETKPGPLGLLIPSADAHWVFLSPFHTRSGEGEYEQAWICTAQEKASVLP